MPRMYIPSSRARQQVLAGGRTPRLKEQKDGSRRENKLRKRRRGGSGGKYGVTTLFKSRPKQMASHNAADEESTTSGIDSAHGGDAEDEDEEDNDDDDDIVEPEVSAPSLSSKAYEAGRYQYDRSDDNLSEADDGQDDGDDDESMFGGSFNPDTEEDLQNRLLDENDDDDAYQAVDDISESDLDDDKILEEQAKVLLADVTSEGVGEDSEDPSFYLNQIEGMSAYGFGDDSDGSLPFLASSQSSDSDEKSRARHVRFEEVFQEQQVFRGFSESPTMTRALLPSALPDVSMHALNGDNDDCLDSEACEEDDSDLTEDDLPEAALRSPHAEASLHDNNPSPETLPNKLRGPPLGRFIDDGSQSAGMLDSTGTVLLITNPQSLGEEFARRYGASAPPSPGLDFAEAVLGDVADGHDMMDLYPSNLLPSELNLYDTITNPGPTTGIYDSMFASTLDGANNILALGETIDGDVSSCSDMDDGERIMRIEDIVVFDSDSDDGFVTSPVVTNHDPFSSPGISHLNNGNVTAFRRNADPTFHTMHSSPMIKHAAARATRLNSSSRTKRGKKRKTEPYSPYSNTCYKGVTPVQRVSHSGNDFPIPEPTPTKRRRTN